MNNYEIKTVIRQSKIAGYGNIKIQFLKIKEIFDNEDGEVIYVIELKSDNGLNIHLCEGYEKESMEVIYCIIKDNITGYIDFNKFAEKNGQIALMTNLSLINKKDVK